jgi:hypothetical protein
MELTIWGQENESPLREILFGSWLVGDLSPKEILAFNTVIRLRFLFLY